ncbi:putative RNA-directed DNA polymerase [Helianthus annuus]|nr:putative RNA-directed DNA polymerase [Helianthus annuus]
MRSKLSKIDRVLVCDGFMTRWPLASFKALQRELSDHSPLVLSCSQVDFGPIPFKLYNYWLDMDGFSETVQEALREAGWVGEGDKAIMELLKKVKGKIKVWRERGRYQEEESRILATQSLAKIEKAAECRLLNDKEKLSRINCKVILKKLEKLKCSELRQKAKVNWIMYGDDNSSFFHKFINMSQASKRINTIIIDGIAITDPDTMKKEIRRVFKDKFDEPMKRRPKLLVNEFQKISLNQARALTGHFSEKEIKDAIWECGGDKAPGPDGFTFKFVKRFWEELKPKFMELMYQFYVSGRINPGCNSSFFTLIPKVQDPQQLSEYRPISLIGVVYKVIAKTLANRLKGVMNSVSSQTQSAFVEKRFIFDGPLIVNEVISWAKKQKAEIMLFKVDFDKAYDSVNWGFLLDNMKMMGFPKRWRRWVNACLSSSKASVLVNGSPSKEFYLKRGLRQGDPLSPFLFILVLEVLEVFMKRAVRLGLFEGVQLPNGGPVLTHLCYADDVIFLGRWSEKNVMNLKRILRCLYLVSGLKVNLAKSSIMGVGVDNDTILAMANNLRCKKGDIPFMFLGLPIGENMKRVKPWRPIIDKFAKKLSRWKSKTLSMGGRITLAKAVLGNLPSYYLSIFKAPLKVIKTLEGIRRDFVWGHTGSRCKMRWVAWSKVQAHMRLGGLGVGEIRTLNWALLLKWKWRFKHYPNHLWSNVIKAIHNRSDGVQDSPLITNIAGNWKDILMVTKDIDKAGIPGAESLGIVALDGSYSVAQFRWKVAEILNIRVMSDGFNWNVWTPCKVLYFIWKLRLGSIAVKTVLAHRGVPITNLSCRMCGREEETIDHLAVSCVFARAVWWHVCMWVKVPTFTQPLLVREMANGLKDMKGSACWKKVIEVIFYATLWRIWKARNALIFDEVQFNVTRVVEAIKEDSYLWIKCRSKFSGLDWERWRDFNVRDIIL